LKLSKAGYGTPEQVLKWSSEMTLLALKYEKFLDDYEFEFLKLNKETS